MNTYILFQGHFDGLSGPIVWLHLVCPRVVLGRVTFRLARIHNG